MKSLIVLFALAVSANAQLWPHWYPWVAAYPTWYGPPVWDRLPALYYPPQQQVTEDEYAASLGGAPVGLYNKRQSTGPYGTNSQVSGISLGKAPVGIYGNERQDSNPNWY